MARKTTEKRGGFVSKILAAVRSLRCPKKKEEDDPYKVELDLHIDGVVYGWGMRFRTREEMLQGIEQMRAIADRYLWQLDIQNMKNIEPKDIILNINNYNREAK